MGTENDDLRTQLQAAFAEARESSESDATNGAGADGQAAAASNGAQAAQQSEQSSGTQPRDDSGRFKPKDGDGAASDIAAGLSKTLKPDAAAAAAESTGVPSKEGAAASKETAPAATAAAAAPPIGWSAEAKAKWHQLPPEVQAAVAKRETDAGKLAGKMDEERALGREVQRHVSPYLAMIQAEGGTPGTAIRDLLNTAYTLRQGSPEQKLRAILATCQQYGVDLSPLVSQPGGQGVHPDVAMLRNELLQLRGRLDSQSQVALAETQVEIDREIEAFAADPAHPHFEAVKADMAALLQAGRAQTMQEAYEMTCWARPDVRATLQAQERASEEQKRRAVEQQRADEARRKAVSVTGGPGAATVPSAKPDRSLREEIAENLRASAGGAV